MASAEVRERITTEVEGIGRGGRDPARAAEVLLPLVYDEMRRLAAGYLARERKEHTLQPTALVHEAYLRLVDQARVDWRGRTHFFAVGAQVMRRLLIDHARARLRDKRGGGRQPVTLSGIEGVSPGHRFAVEDLLALHDALDRLASLDPRQARVVELRFFAGLRMDEIAEIVGVSKRSVEGDWAHARAWLQAELSGRGR